jgi:hypothetical protein
VASGEADPDADGDPEADGDPDASADADGAGVDGGPIEPSEPSA